MPVSLVLFGSLIILIALGVPIALSLGAPAIIAVVLAGGLSPIVVAQRFFTGTDSFATMAIPFFMIAGVLMELGGVSKRLIKLCNIILGSMPGGLAIVTIVTSAFFGALTGSSPATVAAVGGIMIPTMIKMGYSEEFSLATSASSGYLGVIIPPSIAMVTYGVATGASIGSLFIAGFVPGVLIAIALSVYAFFVGKKNSYTNKQKYTFKEFLAALWDAVPALLMPVIILGGIYGGIFTPTEAAAVSILYGLIVGIFIYKELPLKEIPGLFKRAGISSAMVMFIIASASAFGYIMNREMIPVKITNAILGFSQDSTIIFLLFVNLLLLVVGTFMETNAAIMIIVPVLLPVLQALNIDLVHFGLIMTINLGIGMITPPLGVNLFVASGIHGCKVEKVLNRHLVMYLLISIGMLFLFTYVEDLILFLPNLLGR